MTRKLLSLLATVTVLGACDDSPVSLADDQGPQFARSTAAAAAQPGEASIAELAQATEFLSTLVFAIEFSDDNCETSFGAVLGGSRGQFTVFAPTDDAFATALGSLGADVVLSCDVLPTVLAYHVTRGRHMSTSVLAHDRFRMLSGEYAEIDGATIAGAPLDLANIDISASNGIVHVVDAVLLPPSITD